MLKLFDLLLLSDSRFSPSECKLHMARLNDIGEQPIDVFKRGDFPVWQEWQSSKNFTRRYVVSLIAMGGGDWLFAGIFQVEGAPKREVNETTQKMGWRYNLIERDALKAPSGRVIVGFDYKQRNSYIFADDHVSYINVSEILREKPSVSNFGGFGNVDISFMDLNIIIKQNITEWKSALSSVKGIYLITEPDTGMKYVGKADGEHGFWGRFQTYANTSHGTNKGLIRRLDDVGYGAAKNWRISILEVVDLNASQAHIDYRETFWKKILMTRSPFGYNLN